MEEPHIYHFSGGWAATGDGFATFAKTRDEAVRQYQAYDARHCHSQGCDKHASHNVSGVPLCEEHYQNVVSGSGAEDRLATHREDVRQLRSESRRHG